MSGMKPKFIDKNELPKNYYEQPNPYINAPSCNINLLELSRYAKKEGKKLIDLTNDEVDGFRVAENLCDYKE